jgi:hypothetical protein
MRHFIENKLPNQIDTQEIRNVKGFIRKTEAISGARFSGVPDSNIHFQALPFYETGKDQEERRWRGGYPFNHGAFAKGKTAAGICRR